MLLAIQLLCLAGVASGVRITAKEINANFKAVNQQFSTLQKQVIFLKNKTVQLQNALRNRTEEYFWVEENLKRIQKRIHEYETSQKQADEDRRKLHELSTENKRQIHITKTDLLNQVNGQHDAVLRRIAKLEQENKAYKHYINVVEDKLNGEINKNKNLFIRMHMLSSIIRNVNNNMTRTMQHLQNKHSWLHQYVFNQSANVAVMYNIINNLQRDIQDLNEQIHSLELRNQEQERRQKEQENILSQQATKQIVKLIKEQFLLHMQKNRKASRFIEATQSATESTTLSTRTESTPTVTSTTTTTTTRKPSTTSTATEYKTIKGTGSQKRPTIKITTSRGPTVSSEELSTTKLATENDPTKIKPTQKDLQTTDKPIETKITPATTMETTKEVTDEDYAYQRTDRERHKIEKEMSAFRDLIRGFRLKRRFEEVPDEDYAYQRTDRERQRKMELALLSARSISEFSKIKRHFQMLNSLGPDYGYKNKQK